jgi:carbon-monoxide dehydrogenase large subunit
MVGQGRACVPRAACKPLIAGAGRPESIYLMERLLDQAARATGLGPVEIRRRNFIPPDAMPHRTAVGEVYDSGEFAKIMDQVLARADWDGFPARKAESARRGKLRGRGLSTYLEWTGALLRAAMFRIRRRRDDDPSRARRRWARG